MRSTYRNGVLAAALVLVAVGWTPARPSAAPPPDVGPTPESLGTLSFGPNGVLFAADTQAATIYALELGDQASGARAGAADVASIDEKIASVLGTLHPDGSADPRGSRRQPHRPRVRSDVQG